MKKYLRSALSFALALCLVLGMCPAAFAQEGGSILDYSREELMEKLMSFIGEFWPDVEIGSGPKSPVNYVPNENSFYVALGDSSVAAERGNYASLLASELGVESLNLGKADTKLADETFEVIEKNVSHIRDADLITLGYSAHVFLNNAITDVANSYLTNNTRIDGDWVALLGEEFAADVELLLNELRVQLTNQGIVGKEQDTIVLMAESCAYSATVYAVNLPKIIEAIRSHNPTAAIVVVGMYNPVENLDIYMDGSSLDMREYMGYILDAVDTHAADCCAITENASFVSVHNAETKSEAEGEVLSVNAKLPTELAYLATVVRSKMVPSEAGAQYMKNRILLEAVPTYRVAGKDRFDTAFKAADQLKASLDVKRFDTIIVSCGTDFADALSGSYLATVKNAPILLSYKISGMTNDRDIVDYIKANLKAGGLVYILGGTAAVSDSLDSKLTSEGIAVSRLQGANRFLTNLEVLKEAGVGNKDILVCTGLSFADSLAASATGLPILLVFKDAPTAEQAAFLETLNHMNDFVVIGGESAVSGNMFSAISAYGEVERVAGGNRISTSVAIAEAFFADVDRVVLASAANYPDGLCGGALGYSMGAPLLLTMERFEAPITEYVAENYIEKGIILGGEKAVSEAAANASLGK